MSTTSILDAAREGNAMRVKELLQGNPANSSASEEFGTTPLILATEKGSLPTVRVLVEWPGLEMDHRDGAGRTALWHAATWVGLPAS
jgi:ankyrin repeat protein